MFLLFRRVRQSRSQRPSDTADPNARALRARLSCVPEAFSHMFLLLSEKNRVLTTPGVWRGNWDQNGMESSFMPLDYIIGSDITSFFWTIRV